MSDDKGQDWKKALAREAAESESGRLARLQAAASELANAQLLKRQADADYSNKTLALFEEIKNKATDVLNDVSKDARPAPAASPVPVNSYCFEIWRQFPSVRQPGSHFEEAGGSSRYVTKVNFDTAHRMIVVTHMQGFGPEGRFAVEEAAKNGELILKSDAEVISVDELVKRICVPIFRVKGPSA
jgi:hypothetical protein